jgi:hypothetical protein
MWPNCWNKSVDSATKAQWSALYRCNDCAHQNNIFSWKTILNDLAIIDIILVVTILSILLIWVPHTSLTIANDNFGVGAKDSLLVPN